MDEGNELAQTEQCDVPGGETAHEAQRSWVTVLASDANQVAVGVATAGVLYGASKVAGKFRKPPPPPPPGDSDGGE